MSFDKLMNNAGTLTAQRKAYAMTCLENMAKQLAHDLKDGHTTREVGLYAVSQIAAGYIPSTGKGHADKINAAVSEEVDQYLATLDEEYNEKGKDKKTA